MSFHKFTMGDGIKHGSFEVIEIEGRWYWQACWPGCLPDGEINGPFDTEQAAVDDANEPS